MKVNVHGFQRMDLNKYSDPPWLFIVDRHQTKSTPIVKCCSIKEYEPQRHPNITPYVIVILRQCLSKRCPINLHSSGFSLSAGCVWDQIPLRQGGLTLIRSDSQTVFLFIPKVLESGLKLRQRATKEVEEHQLTWIKSEDMTSSVKNSVPVTSDRFSSATVFFLIVCSPPPSFTAESFVVFVLMSEAFIHPKLPDSLLNISHKIASNLPQQGYSVCLWIQLLTELSTQ